MSPTPLHPADRMALVIDEMRVSAAGWKNQGPWLTRHLQNLICRELDRLFATILSILAQIRDGTLVLPTPRAREPEAAADPTEPAAAEAGTRPAARTPSPAAYRQRCPADEIDASFVIEADPRAEGCRIIPARRISRHAIAPYRAPRLTFVPSRRAMRGPVAAQTPFSRKSLFADLRSHVHFVTTSKHFWSALG